MSRLQPDIDMYGTYARASAVADYLELLALNSVSISRESLRDYVTDNGWASKLRENFVPPTGDASSDPEVDDIVERVLAVTAERAEVLGDHYPFSLDGVGRLMFNNSDTGIGYLLLLAITTAHAHALDVEPNPRALFQEVVARVLAARGWLSINFARAREGRSFEEAVKHVAETLGLVAVTGAAYRNARAQDAGVDCIAHLPWCDGRSGRWLVIAQATCAKSNDWKRKMYEPGDESWRLRFGEAVLPLVLLAVPHHVEGDHRNELFQETSRRRLLMDRLSMARYLSPLTPDETAVLNAVMNSPLELP